MDAAMIHFFSHHLFSESFDDGHSFQLWYSLLDKVERLNVNTMIRYRLQAFCSIC